VFFRDHCLVYNFPIVLEALTRELWEGIPMEQRYADDLVMMTETEELLVEKIQRWRRRDSQ